MVRDSAIRPESFEEILAWLNPDREVAAIMYVELREDLSKSFTWRGCHDPEGLTDEVFDRVARKVHDVRKTYKGDPRLYFHAVANNVIKEYLKKKKTHVALESIDPPIQPTTGIDDETANIEECLQKCLQELSRENRELILDYYAKEKQARIDHRSKLAESLAIPVETLRVKVHRIRVLLDQCVERCLERKAK